MTTIPSDQTDFPQEIVAQPLALIHLAGLDCINNAVHKSIWDAFSNNRRTDRVNVQFRLLNNSCEFPIAKPKRNSYDWYVPKGILKKNWIYKRIALIPAVIVIFYDMEWNDPQWNEKSIECVSRVQSIRAAMEGHLTRMSVVVIQSGPAPPPSENALGAERATALCQACDIQSKYLFVLPQGENMLSYVIRLENAFYDLAQNYYHHETKNIKQHRDHLNKNIHQYLFVRHQFKLGFLHEMKQDLSTAHKHYMYAYNNLLEVRIVETNTYEVKTVAGYINYKLCKLLFNLSLPRDAINQFRAHIDRYKSRSDPKELLFEHYAWLARQYSAFGELFDEAIRSGQPAIQSQHPGFYYQIAAQFTVKRRQAMQQYCIIQSLEYPEPDPLEGVIDFYGQRQWRPGRLSADSIDPAKEEAAIKALQFKERHFNHSSMIINFLGSAITQFKTFHSPRMRKQLVVEMANEYYLISDYGKALTLLSHMLYDYRREKWWFLASYVLNKALSCAYLSAKLQDYINLSIEALSKHITVPNNDKNRIFFNILSVLNMAVPNPEPDLPKESLSVAFEEWKKIIASEPHDIKVDMSTLSKFMEVKVRFSQSKYKPEDDVYIALYVRLNCSIELDVVKLVIIMASQSQTFELPAQTDDKAPIKLTQREVKKFVCHFKLGEEQVSSDLLIKNVVCSIGGSGRKIDLSFSLTNNIADRSVHPELLHFISSPKSDYEFDSIVSLPVARVTARECKLLIEAQHSNPALQGEWYPMQYTITNEEDRRVKNLNVSIKLASSPDNPNPDASTELKLDPDSSREKKLDCDKNDKSNMLQVSLNNLEIGDVVKNNFFIKSMKISTIVIILKVSYILETRQGISLECTKEHNVKVSVVKPFEVNTKFLSMSFEPVDKCFCQDPFIIKPEIRILSPWEIIIEGADLELTDSYKFLDPATPPSCLLNEIVNEGMIISDVFAIISSDKTGGKPPNIGLYNIKWRRVDNSKVINVTKSVLSSIVLAGITVEDGLVKITSELTEKAKLYVPIIMECKVKSTKDTPVRLNISTEGTDSFMYAGYKKRLVSIRPDENEVLSYVINPLVSGSTTPPKLKVSVYTNEETSIEDSDSTLIQKLVDKNLPANVHVMPFYKK